MADKVAVHHVVWMKLHRTEGRPNTPSRRKGSCANPVLKIDNQREMSSVQRPHIVSLFAGQKPDL
jgi:hypothetical protein